MENSENKTPSRTDLYMNMKQQKKDGDKPAKKKDSRNSIETENIQSGGYPASNQKQASAGTNPQKKKKKGGGILLAIAIILIVAGIGFVAYPMILGQMSYAAMNKLSSDFKSKMGNVEDYTDIDINAMQKSAQTNSNAWKTAGDILDGESVIPAPMPDWESLGNPDMQLEIPDINLVCGVFKTENLQQMYTKMRGGTSLYPETPMPGFIGNTAMAGHRTGPSDFFRHLDLLVEGESKIYLHALDKSYAYLVEKKTITMPDDWTLIEDTDEPVITLTTCQEFGGVSNARRLIVRAKLIQTANHD